MRNDPLRDRKRAGFKAGARNGVDASSSFPNSARRIGHAAGAFPIGASDVLGHGSPYPEISFTIFEIPRAASAHLNDDVRGYWAVASWRLTVFPTSFSCGATPRSALTCSERRCPIAGWFFPHGLAISEVEK